MNSPSGTAVRLTFADDAFLRRHRGWGSPVVNQFVWRFDVDLPRGTCEAFAGRLARGAFGRRSVRAPVPGARARWHPEPGVPAVRRHDAPLDGDGLAAWITACADRDLDPAVGPAWEVATADLVGGGCVVSMVVAHAVADGSAMLDAVVRAAADAAPLTLGPGPSGPAALAGDLADAVGQVTTVARWGARVAGAALSRTGSAGTAPATPSPTPATPAPPPPSFRPPTGWEASWLVTDLSSAEVRAAAEASGGSVNAWFVAAVAGLVRRSGRTLGPDGVRVALPVSTRGTDDPRGNATRIARVVVPVEVLDAHDLDAVRTACKTAYAALEGAVEPLPLALVQMLPDRVVGRLPPPPAAAALASNLGTPPPALATLGGVTARSVAALAHQRGLGVDEAAATGGGLLAFLCDTGERTTLSVVAVDPFRVADLAELRALVEAELASWSLVGQSW